MTDFTLADLERIVSERGRSGADDSWTAKLFAKGPERAAKKMGEEAVELVSETADLLYHMTVVLALAEIPISDVMAELERRTGQSGIAEKASRPQ
jgi:phosphoribosyl-ATP pyrophosphohydrolase